MAQQEAEITSLINVSKNDIPKPHIAGNYSACSAYIAAQDSG